MGKGFVGRDIIVVRTFVQIRVRFPWGDSSSLFVHIAPNFLHCMRSKQSSEVIFTVEPHIDVSLKSWFTKYLGSWVCFIVR